MATKRTLITGAHSGLNGLLNCAGIRVLDRRTTVDGIELMDDPLSTRHQLGLDMPIMSSFEPNIRRFAGGES